MNNNDIDYSKGKMPKVPLVLSFIIVAFAILYFSKYLEWERKPFSDGNIDESQIHEITDLEDNPVSGQHLTNENAKNLYSKYDFTKVQNYYGDSFKDIYFSNKGISNEYMMV